MVADDTPLTHDELRRLLRYDPDKGAFYWLVARPPRARAGDKAGGFQVGTNYYLVTIKGRNYYGHKLAFFYMTGEWPLGDVRFADYDTSNIAWDNISFVRRTYSREPSAVAARKLQQRKRAARRQATDASLASPLPGVIVFSPTAGKWRVFLPWVKAPVAAFETTSSARALQWYALRQHGKALVDASPLPEILASDGLLRAGDRFAVTYAELHTWLVYDPATGAFYYRQRSTRGVKSENVHNLSMGERADFLNTTGTPMVDLFGRKYTAANLAVFMQTRLWRTRGEVRHRDRNKANNAWDNLEFDA